MKATIDCILVIVNIYYPRYLAGRAIIGGEAGGVAVGWNNDRQDNHIHHVCVNTGGTRGRGSRGQSVGSGRSLAWSVAKHVCVVFSLSFSIATILLISCAATLYTVLAVCLLFVTRFQHTNQTKLDQTKPK